IYAELSFYNKLAEEADWEANIRLKCYALDDNRNEICDLNINRRVLKGEAEVYVREGWGHADRGHYWRRGHYRWEAWINGEKVATQHFYVEDHAEYPQPGGAPYMALTSVKMYEGSYEGVAQGEREYVNVFAEEDTRYIFFEVEFKNLYVQRSWQCELFLRISNEVGELKSEIVQLRRIMPKEESCQMIFSWGSDKRGTWYHGNYRAELSMLEEHVATIFFEVGDDFVQGLPEVELPEEADESLLFNDGRPDKSLGELIADLEALIGLQSIKDKVKEHAAYIRFVQLRKEKGFSESEGIKLHSVFIGNPGTGKTTVAQMMGQLYKKMGLLSKGHVHEVDRSHLVGEYIGQTAPKVKEAIEKARGGVLFIDEAYSLARSKEDHKDFGREAIEILVKEMSNGKGDLVMIVAGYPKEMKEFLESNPGLKSRFKHYFNFPDYLPQELMQIAEYSCRLMEIELHEGARERLNELIVEAYRKRDRTFGNARFVNTLLEEAKINMGLRVIRQEHPEELPVEALKLIMPEDIESIDLEMRSELPDIPVDEVLLKQALAELNKLIGLETIKSQINELVHLVRFYRQTGQDVLNTFFLHTVFVGNPGTGKTTVARILAKIYKALGIIERGHMVETDRQGLVANYVGQTATKTAKKVEEAMGGILFIDEAYSLTQRTSAGGDFGQEAIQTLLKRMEDHRGKFFVFVAGYPDNMDAFLKANPGLSSRFDKILKFEDYTPEQLHQIALLILDERQMIMTPEADAELRELLASEYRSRSRYFGNAREVRKLMEELIKRQNLRLAQVAAEERKNMPVNLIQLEDVQAVGRQQKDQNIRRQQIGFGG
ncbi:MAG TPA: AAA family ATPase, partial [Phaeodactylibacter sp.]|nr:AAA family ATPase [Phaeodactylibacter sp.]